MGETSKAVDPNWSEGTVESGGDSDETNVLKELAETAVTVEKIMLPVLPEYAMTETAEDAEGKFNDPLGMNSLWEEPKEYTTGIFDVDSSAELSTPTDFDRFMDI